MSWDEFRDLANTYNRFLISSHLSQDGDCVGSQLAMFWYLKSLHKEVEIYNYDPVPRKFMFLENASVIAMSLSDIEPEVLIVLDCSNLHRLGWNAENKAPIVVNIDHHRDNGTFGTVNIVDSDSAATGEILFRFFRDYIGCYPEHVAESLYTAILTDTGGFRFSNTSGKILRICADLADKGANAPKIYDKVYASHSPEALLLQAKIWSTLKYHCDGKICSMEMPLSVLEEIGAVYSDSEGMADCTITAEGVEVGIMVKYGPTETHFSLRSRGTIDVGKIAQRIPEGGGHFSAAGCTINKPFDEAFSYMLAILRQELH